MNEASGDSKWTRRQFLAKGCAAALAAVFGLPAASACAPASQPPTQKPIASTPTSSATWGEAMHYRRLEDGRVHCQICFRECVVAPGQLGFCRNKKNVDGTYYSLVYGLPCALQLDPIEKEPVFHMLPGSRILGVGTAACNSRCKFCQNWEMSQHTLWETLNYRATPADVVERALALGCDAVSFTYNEPTVFYEYAYDIAVAARSQGLRVICHTNGTMLAAPLLQLLAQLDAITVDLKAFTSEFYRRVCTLELEPVLATLKQVAQSGVHLEIVNLVIPTLNDNPDDIRNMCQWIVEHLGTEVPLHFTRFFPAYKLQHLPATPIETLEKAVAIADQVGLQYVYLGNVPGHKRNSTYCPKCGERLLFRLHFTVLENNLADGKCRFCGYPIAGIWSG